MAMEDAIFRAVVDYTPKVCVERPLQNGDGLYRNEKFIDLEEQCLVFEDLLRELFQIAKQLNPRDAQGALRRFNAARLGKLFEEHAEGGRSARSARVQAQGIINLIAYVNKRRRNWVDGSRARAGIGRLVRASAEAIEPAAVRRRSKTPPSRTPPSSRGSEKAQACSYRHDSMVRALSLTEQKDFQVLPVAAQDAPDRSVVKPRGGGSPGSAQALHRLEQRSSGEAARRWPHRVCHHVREEGRRLRLQVWPV